MSHLEDLEDWLRMQGLDWVLECDTADRSAWGVTVTLVTEPHESGRADVSTVIHASGDCLEDNCTAVLAELRLRAS